MVVKSPADLPSDYGVALLSIFGGVKRMFLHAVTAPLALLACMAPDCLVRASGLPVAW
jgi:hypothetical protein